MTRRRATALVTSVVAVTAAAAYAAAPATAHAWPAPWEWLGSHIPLALFEGACLLGALGLGWLAVMALTSSGGGKHHAPRSHRAAVAAFRAALASGDLAPEEGHEPTHGEEMAAAALRMAGRGLPI
jgi:hypothetical protein